MTFLKNLQKEIKELKDLVSSNNANQTEAERQLLDLKDAVDFISNKFDEFECMCHVSTTTYFKGARQGDPISAFVFILTLGILFLLIKENPRINGSNIFNHCYIYSAYADDTSFFLNFLKDVNSIKEMVNSFHIFSRFSGFRPNLSNQSKGIKKVKVEYNV